MPKTSHISRLGYYEFIHQRILARQFPNASKLSAVLELSIRTVQQYIRELPEIYGVTPTYDRTNHGYFYETPHAARPQPRLSDKEIVAYFLLEESARCLGGSPVKSYLDTILAKFATMLPIGDGLSVEQFSAAVSFRLERAPANPPQAAVLADLFQCIYAKKRARIDYEGRERKQFTERTIDPIHLARIDGQWFLIAWCHLRKAIRTFVPGRIRSMKLLDERFKTPEGFNAGAHLRSAFGIVSGKDVTEISLLFDARVADLIAERSWHVTQLIERRPGGALRLKMTCSIGQELESWLLSWGPDVRVEHPRHLAQKVSELHLRATQSGT